jgi:hypothetical protein
LKLVVLKIKSPPCGGTRPSERTFCRSVHSSTERVLARIIRLSKSRPPVQQVGLQAIQKYSPHLYHCQALPCHFPQASGARMGAVNHGQRSCNYDMLSRAFPKKERR